MNNETERDDTKADVSSAGQAERCVRVRFNDAKNLLPEEIPIIDDQREFMFVAEGTPYCGYFRNGVFKDTNGNTHIDIDAWVEWEEI